MRRSFRAQRPIYRHPQGFTLGSYDIALSGRSGERNNPASQEGSFGMKEKAVLLRPTYGSGRR